MDELTTISSSFGPKETADRLESVVKSHGLTVFARINHAALATEVGMALRPTEVLLFGNPRGGTPLMQAAQTIGIDLPLKALVWQDAAGNTWISYNEPAWLAQRHGLGPATDKITANMSQALKTIVASATEQNATAATLS